MKRKIVFFVNSLSGGGAEKILQTFLSRWDARNWEITIYCLKKEDVPPGYPSHISFRFLLDCLRDGDSAWRRLRVKARNKLKLLVYRHFPPSVFYRLFVRGTYEVEVAFIEGHATRIASGSPHADSRKLAWVHIDLVSNHWTLPSYHDGEEERQAYHRFDTVVSVSRDVQRSLEELTGPLRDARVLYNPVDVPEIREKSREFIPDRPEGKVLFCASGRLVHQKGFDRLVEACRCLERQGYPFHLWILGEGADGEKLKALVAEWNLQDRITFLGHVENPYPYMLAADWVVCSSRSEGHSSVISESLILGVPVVSTLCSGVREQLGDGEFGVVTDNDGPELCRALEDILKGKVDSREFRERARRGGARFDLEGQMNALEKLLEKTVESSCL